MVLYFFSNKWIPDFFFLFFIVNLDLFWVLTHLGITPRFNARQAMFCDLAHFFALFHFVFLDRCSEDHPAFGGLDRNVDLRPCGVLPGMWS